MFLSDNDYAWFNLMPDLATKFDFDRAKQVQKIGELIRQKRRLQFDP
jgi:hypothetical protein